MDAGFLYVLINASMPDVVKVGKTERDPESRARELSGVTGVPTPFVVVYQEFFDDCSAAEEYVHALLEASGYRVATNREFFSAPSRVAIQALIQAKAALGGKGDGAQPPTASAQSELPANPQSEPWADILDRARAARDGLGDAIEDPDEASRLYQQAAKLGSGEACYQLGLLYLSSDFSDADDRTAVSWLNEGSRRGFAACYAELARFYLQHRHAENAEKSWARYRKASAGHEDNEFWGECFYYLLTAADTKINIDFDWFQEHGDEIVRGQDEFWERFRNLGGGRNGGGRSAYDEADLCVVRFLLNPNAPLARSKGILIWWNEETNRGIIMGEDGREAFLEPRQIVEGTFPPAMDQPCDFVPVENGEHPIACVVRLLGGSPSRDDVRFGPASARTRLEARASGSRSREDGRFHRARAIPEGEERG